MEPVSELLRRAPRDPLPLLLRLLFLGRERALRALRGRARGVLRERRELDLLRRGRLHDPIDVYPRNVDCVR